MGNLKYCDTVTGRKNQEYLIFRRLFQEFFRTVSAAVRIPIGHSKIDFVVATHLTFPKMGTIRTTILRILIGWTIRRKLRMICPVCHHVRCSAGT